MAVAGTLEIEVLLNGKKAKIGLDQLKKRMGVLNKTAFQTNRVFGKLARFATIGYLGKIVLDASKLNRELGIMSKMTGIGFESISKMRNAFKYAGGDAKTLDKAISSISQRLAHSRVFGDSEGFVRSLSLMGIQDFTKNPKEILAKVADYVSSKVKERQTIYESKGYNKSKATALAQADVFAFVRQVIPEMDYILFQELLKGSKAFLASIENAAGLSEEAGKNLDDAGKRWTEFTTNLKTGIEEVAGLLLEKEKELGILEKGARFSKKHPVASTALTGLGIFGGLKFAKWGIQHTAGPIIDFIAKRFGYAKTAEAAANVATKTTAQKAATEVATGAVTKSPWWMKFMKAGAFLSMLLTPDTANEPEVEWIKGLNLARSESVSDRMKGIYMMLASNRGVTPSRKEFEDLADKYGIDEANRKLFYDAFDKLERDFGVHKQGKNYFYNELPKVLGIGDKKIYSDDEKKRENDYLYGELPKSIGVGKEPIYLNVDNNFEIVPNANGTTTINSRTESTTNDGRKSFTEGTFTMANGVGAY